MENEIIKNEEEIEINLLEVFNLFKTNYKLIIISIILCALLGGIATAFIPKKYASTARIYPKPIVNDSGMIDNSQLSASSQMIKNYVAMLNGNNIQGQVAKLYGLSTGELNDMISISNETGTHIITITATTKDPVLSKNVVDALVITFTNEAEESLGVTNITTVDKSVVAENPVSPSLKKNLLISMFLGLFGSCGFIFIKYLLDNRIHSEEEAERYFNLPCLGSIPYFED